MRDYADHFSFDKFYTDILWVDGYNNTSILNSFWAICQNLGNVNMHSVTPQDLIHGVLQSYEAYNRKTLLLLAEIEPTSYFLDDILHNYYSSFYLNVLISSPNMDDWNGSDYGVIDITDENFERFAASKKYNSNERKDNYRQFPRMNRGSSRSGGSLNTLAKTVKQFH